MPFFHTSLKRRQTWLIILVLVVAATALGLHRFIRDQTVRWLVLHSESANPEAVEELIAGETDPAPFLWQLWHTRKILQREDVLKHLKNLPPANLPAQVLPLLHEAALDPDANLRELALGILQSRQDPQLPDLARAQLRDADPQIRMLGIQYLRTTGDTNLTPELIALLDDPDPAVVVTADAALRRWTGNDFGLRLVSAVSKINGDSQPVDEPSRLEKINAGADKWRAWWRANQVNYRAVPPLQITFPTLEEAPLAGNFALKDLNGRTVHFSDFQGRTVLLNFWTTWCTACQEEMPRLVELQKLHPELAIVSISLDGAQLDDEDDSGIQVGNQDAVSVRKKIERLVKSRGINYRILLDPEGKIGARFNGNELPVNVLIDSKGRVRRRFIGARSVTVLEAMVQEVAKS